MTDSAKVILKKKEVRSNTGLTPEPLALFERDASLPGLSPAEKEPEPETCRAIRRDIRRSRPEIDLAMISYMRLSLLTVRASDTDGHQPTRLAVNMDCSFNNNTQFQRFKWRVTNKRSEFYANLPQGWETDLAYGSAWEYYNELTMTRWIGKATYRMNRRDNASRMKLVPLTAIVMWTDGEDMYYRLWLESAEVTGVFNIASESRFYLSGSEPIKNFRPSGMRAIQL